MTGGVGFRRYLAAKRTVDDRALDRRLIDELGDRLSDHREDGDPLGVLEVGAGIGTMVERLLEWDLLPGGTTGYTALDVDPDNTAAVPGRLRSWGEGRDDRGVRLTGDGAVVIETPERRVEVSTVTADAAGYAAGGDRRWDLLVGAALLDLLPAADLPTLLGALKPGGLWYFPLVFDGVTRFRPAHPADRAVERHYHAHMDAEPGGDSRAGSTTLAELQSLEGVSVLGVAGSDWIVRPADDDYPGDEAAFLRHVLGTVEDAVGEAAPDRFEGTLADWLASRRAQLDAGELSYLTHQLDLLGRVDEPEALPEG